MGDPGVKNSTDSGSKSFGIRATGCGSYSLSSSVTNSGVGACGGVEFNKGYYDGYYLLGLEYEWFLSNGRTFPGGGDGTTSENEANVIAVTFGKTKRPKIWRDGDQRSITRTSTTMTSVGVGWQDLGGGSRTVGGETFDMEGTSWTALRMEKSYLGGFEFGVNRFVIHPQIGIGIATLYPLTGVKQRSEFPWNPRDINIKFRLDIGYNDASDENLLHAPINGYDIANEMTSDVLGYLQRGLSYSLVDKPTAEGEDLLEELHMGVGGASQQTEDIKFLKSLTFIAGAMGISNDIGFYYRARRGNSGSAYVKLVGRGLGGVGSIIGGLASGTGGEGLVADGISDLQGFYGALLTESNLTATEQLGARIGVAAGLQLLGGLLSAEALSDGGGRGMVANAMTPDPTDADIVSRTFIAYAPISGFFSSGGDGSRGSIAMTNFIPLTDNWNFLTYLELTSHLMAVANLGKRAGNATDDDYSAEYDSVGLPTTIRTGVGFAYDVKLGDIGLFIPSIGIHTLQIYNGETDAGLGFNAGVEFMFNLPKGFKIGFGGKGLLDMPFRHNPVSFDIQPTIIIGYTN